MRTNWIHITLITLAMIICFGCSGKKDTGFLFKYANSQPEQHPRSQSMIFFKEELEKRSQGKIRVENYFSAVLGTEFEVQDMVATGALQGTRGGGFIHANKKYYIYTLPFIVNNWDEALRLMHSEFTQEVNMGARENGYHIPACGISQGFRAHTNNQRPIQTPDDLKGLKMRVPQQEVYIVNAQALGVNPQELPYSEVYMALKTGVVDGQDNAVSNIWDYKIYEVQKYLSLSNYGTGPDPFMVNLAWYNTLPPELQKLFDQVAIEAMNFSDRLNQENESIYIQKLSEKLETNIISPENLDKFRKATEPVYTYFIKKGYFSMEDISKAKSSIIE